MKPSAKNYKRIVVKVGGSLLCSQNGRLDLERLSFIVDEVCELIQAEGKEIVIVSSGAIALGMGILGLKSRPKELPLLQAAAAVGQNALMEDYGREFKKKNINCAQILLTWEDFSSRKRYLNAKNTLQTLLKLKSAPIINENDSISTDEIKFGDNDRLSALVAILVSADLLIILSDVEGLLDKDKRVVRVVPQISATIKELASPTQKKTCVGGMITKIEAAKIATDSGIPCVIASGRKKGIILAVAKQVDSQGTLFLSKDTYLAARKRWIAFGTKPKGKIIVDDGAKSALENNKSLLSVGVSSCSGNFSCGDIVSVVDKNDYEFARGKVRLNCKELEKAKGVRFNKEVIHRDDIVIL